MSAEKQLSALVLIADGSEEIETVTPLDVLVRAGFAAVTSVGVGLKILFTPIESVKSPRADGEAAKKCKVTSHPSVKQEIVDAGWTYADDSERVVVDGKIITSRGPGTALLFSLTIVEQLAGKAKKDEVHGPMICAGTL
ncbi:unnamed protein product [Aureobasidium pullulans]|nr:unnamed protein product [Aureobasidium pullulans]